MPKTAALSALKSIGMTSYGKMQRTQRARATAPVRARLIRESLIGVEVYQKQPQRVLENATSVPKPPAGRRQNAKGLSGNNCYNSCVPPPCPAEESTSFPRKRESTATGPPLARG